jgi:Mrp family chromosome partitioning ATPase/predicted Fe-Mo cluster-binding NifX family protein
MSAESTDHVKPSAGGVPPEPVDEREQQRRALADRLSHIRHKVMVLSGKGGVGKSTVAVNIARALAEAGRSVGLLDVDVHGPSVPRMLGLQGQGVQIQDGTILPVTAAGLKVISLGFMLPERDAAVIWRGPMKMNVIRQFLTDTAWGDLDYLIIDSPPGTGDEPLSVAQLVEGADGAVIVTTPQEVALADVRKSINFCRQLSLPVLGVVENMSGFACPACGEVTDLFGAGGGERMAAEMGVPFLGRVPIDPKVVEACDAGLPVVGPGAEGPTVRAFEAIVGPLLALDASAETNTGTQPQPANDEETRTMRIAIPLAEGKLALHFGHCREFALVDVDPASGAIEKTETTEPPPHAPGVLPKWLADQGAEIIIAGGMGRRAQDLFAEHGIQTIVGAPSQAPEDLVAAYVAGDLQTGDNLCDH